jgi:hypothetical protein
MILKEKRKKYRREKGKHKEAGTLQFSMIWLVYYSVAKSKEESS